ncbi:MAG: lactate/malate family dehydrogenase [Alphaproteobacteria bacterium]
MKVGIIGAGNVGSATAFALVMRGVARKVVLIDANEARAKAEAADIAHASPFADASKIKAGTYEDLKGCRSCHRYRRCQPETRRNPHGFAGTQRQNF